MVDDDDAEFLAEMKGDFLENVPTELEDCESCLMRFEKSGEEAEIAEFKRLVHSIKGGARMVALNEFSNYLHTFETKLAKCGQENRMKEFVLFALPFIDQLRTYIGALRDDSGHEAEGRKVEAMLEKFS